MTKRTKGGGVTPATRARDLVAADLPFSAEVDADGVRSVTIDGPSDRPVRWHACAHHG